MSRPEGIWRATAVMTVATGLSRATGVLRVSAMAFALGVTGTRLADTYNLANTLPNMIYELFLGGVFTSIFVPVFEDIRRRRPGQESALISVSLLLLAVLAAAVAVGAPLIMRIYTFRISDPATRQAQLELSTALLRWFAPQIFFYGLGALAGALLNTRERRRFGPPMFTPALNNLVVTGVLLGFAWTAASRGLDQSSGAVLLLGLGTTAGVVVQAVTLLPFLRGQRFRFTIDLKDPGVRQVLRLATFVIGYVVVNQVGIWVVYALANGVRGGVTAYQVAFMFFQLPHGLFAVSIVTALLPDLSGHALARAWDRFRDGLHTGLRALTFLLVPAAVGYAMLAGPVTRLLLAHGAAGRSDAAVVAAVLQAFAVGLPAFSVFQLLLRHFYAMQDTRTPALLNAVAVGINIAIDLPLFVRFGVVGLAAGHSITYAVGAVLLGVALSRRIGGLEMGSLTGHLARVGAASAVMAAAVGACLRFVESDVLVVGAGVLVGGMAYLVAARLMGVEEVSLGTLMGRGRRSG